MKLTCPGPGTKAWGPDAIFEIPCATCGEGIEFFKDDEQRTCPACGKVTRNPRRPLGTHGSPVGGKPGQL
jgi:hypothetical protein